MAEVAASVLKNQPIHPGHEHPTASRRERTVDYCDSSHRGAVHARNWPAATGSLIAAGRPLAQPLLNHDQPQTAGSDRTPLDADKINP
jgi:hypothetical protein